MGAKGYGLSEAIASASSMSPWTNRRARRYHAELKTYFVQFLSILEFVETNVFRLNAEKCEISRTEE